jgi:hypothetical protein
MDIPKSKERDGFWEAPEKHAAVAPAGKHPVQEAMAKTGGFRDRVIPGEVERRFSEL